MSLHLRGLRSSVAASPPAAWDAVAADPEPFLAVPLRSREWLDRCLPALLEDEALLHFDVRSDNLSIRGGEAILVRPAGVERFAGFVAGFFAARAGLPPPAGSPTVRAFQLAQLEVALPWASGVLGLPES